MFSGAIIYESWTLSLYNVFFTVLPPLAMGILDQFVSARLLDRYPQLYNLGQSNRFFRLRVFVAWIANAVYHSLILYIFGVLLWPWDLIQGDGKTAGHWVWGTGMYGAVLLTVLGKAGLVTNNWTKYHVIAIPGSMAFWIAFIAAYATVAPMVSVSEEYFGTVPRIFSSPVFWLQILVLPVLCLLRDVGYKYAKRMYRPQNYHHIQEIQKYNIQDYRPRYVLPLLSPLTLRRSANSTCHQDGAIPKGDPQGTPGTTHAQAERVRLLAGGRVADTRASGVRHDAEQRKVRRDGLIEAALESGNDRDGRARRRRKRRRRERHKVASNEINHLASSSSLCPVCYNAHCTMMMRRCPTIHGREFQYYDKTKQANIHTYNQRGMYERARLFMGAKAGGRRRVGTGWEFCSPLYLPPGNSPRGHS